MKFDPYKVEQFHLGEGEMELHPNGHFVSTDDFNEMLDWWEERGKEIERLEKILVGVNALTEEWRQ